MLLEMYGFCNYMHFHLQLHLNLEKKHCDSYKPCMHFVKQKASTNLYLKAVTFHNEKKLNQNNS